jgi:hypothetical protein
MSFGFYDAGPVRQLATNLFYGWGYNFYRAENQLRADDQLVRSKAAWLLGLAKVSVDAVEADYRREFLPPPTRQKPFPDPSAVAGAQRLERLAREIGALEVFIHQQPVPENDRMTQRYRQEKATLQALIDCDEQLVGRCELLRTLVDAKNSTAILETMPALEEGLKAIRAALQQREASLFGRIP